METASQGMVDAAPAQCVSRRSNTVKVIVAGFFAGLALIRMPYLNHSPF